ncbi:outer membrane beta-barrel protein [Niabella sp. CJ426]|uniref:outer membrane beta-barrel protein n=1 Tax=Niabella sp. CJ426 TaxID=3393740 RepID=UPI003CFE9BDD
MSEVIVHAQKQLIQEFPDKLVYNVEGDPDAESSPLLDIMRKIPSLNVVGDDAMDVNGQGFLVIVNGRKAGIFKQSPVQVMRTFPAKLVKSVEVITSPSAKYDAEGVGAIINIVLRRKKFEGYNASLTANSSTLQNNSLVGLITLKQGRVGFNGYYAPVFSHRPATSTEQELNYTNLSAYSVSQSSTVRNKYRNLTYNNEISWEIDSMSLLNVGYSNSLDNRRLDYSISSVLYDYSGQAAERFRNASLQKGRTSVPAVNVDYQRRFDEDGEKLLSISYYYEQSRYRERTYQDITGLLNAPSGENFFSNNETEKEHTIQLDYSHPLFSNSLEMGTKAIFRENNSDYLFDLQAYDNPSLQNGSLKFNQNVFAGYVSYGWRGKYLSAQAGYRGEYTTVSLKSISNSDYFTSVPGAAISYKLKAGPVLKLAYSKRIQRPGISYINPFTDIVNNRFVREGNASLKPENFNIIEFTASQNTKKVNQRISLSQTISSNTIQVAYLQMPDSVLKATYLNIGHYRLTNLQYYINHKINAVASHVLKWNLGYRYFGDGDSRLNDGWNTSGDYSFNYRSKKNFKGTLNVGYISYTPTTFGKTEGRFYNFLLLGQDLFKRKVTVDLSFRNFFPKNLTVHSDFKTNGLEQWSRQTVLQREIRLSLSYRFGKLKERVERTEKSVENDDLLKIERKDNVK